MFPEKVQKKTILYLLTKLKKSTFTCTPLITKEIRGGSLKETMMAVVFILMAIHCEVSFQSPMGDLATVLCSEDTGQSQNVEVRKR